MYCSKCGTPLKGNERFCPKCGNSIASGTNAIWEQNAYINTNASVVEEADASVKAPSIETPYMENPENGMMEPEQEETEKRHSSKIYKILIPVVCVALLALFCGTIFLYKWYTGDEQSVIRALKKGDYDKASALLADDYDGSQQAVERTLSEIIEKLKSDYKNKKIEYSDAASELDAIAEMKISGMEQQIDDAKKYISTLYASRTAFETAENSYKNGDYAEAIRQYRNVIQEDDNYDAAKNQIEGAIGKYSEQVLQETDELVTAGLYKEAVNAVGGALEVLPDDEKLQSEYEACASEYADNVISEAEEYVSNDDYENAISILNEGIAELEKNEKLEDKLEEYTEAVSAEADKKILKKETLYYKNGTLGGWTEYDETGKIKKEIFYQGAIYEDDYEYDDAGNLIKKTSTHSSIDGDEVYEVATTKNKYDDAGNLIKVLHYDMDGKLTGYKKNKYDDAGNLIKESEYDSEKKLTGYRKNKYDDAGNLVKTAYCDSDGSQMECTKNKYDDAGNLIKTSDYDSENNLTRYTKYKYDDTGNLIKISYYDSESNLTTYRKNKYDDTGNLVKTLEYDSDGNIAHRAVYEYDEAGDLIKYTFYWTNDNYEQTIFEYYGDTQLVEDTNKDNEGENEDKDRKEDNTQSWKQAYIDYIDEIENEASSDVLFSLIQVNDDDIPELLIDYRSTAGGGEVATFDGMQVNTIHTYSYCVSYMPEKNLMCDSGGHMDEYYDYIYKIENGQFVKCYSGEYGAEDNSHVECDENGYPIYRYYWEGVEVEKDEYDELLNAAFDTSNKVSPYDNCVTGFDEIIEAIHAY